MEARLQGGRLRPTLANKYPRVEERRLPLDHDIGHLRHRGAAERATRTIPQISISLLRGAVLRTSDARQCAFSRVTRLIYFRLMTVRDNYDPVG